MDTVRTRPNGPVPERVAAAPARGATPRVDVIPATLFEDVDGRLVVVDARCAPHASINDTPLLRIGSVRLTLPHLRPSVVGQLATQGYATVEGPDAVTVLLAFAAAVERGDDPA